MSWDMSGSALIYLLGWILVWRERKDEILEHQRASFALFCVFGAITLVGDFTPLFPTRIFCAVVWPVFALFILEGYVVKPHVTHIESELKKINEDITEDIRLREIGKHGLFENESYRIMMIHRRDLLSEISRFFKLL